MNVLVDINVTMTVASNWRVTCVHGPEIVDRILMALRKRSIAVERMSYEHEGEHGVCTLEFSAEMGDTQRIYKNLLRLTEVHEVDTAPR